MLKEFDNVACTNFHIFRMSDDRIVVGASQNVPNRIQQTRRDADSVIEEVNTESFTIFTSTFRSWPKLP